MRKYWVACVCFGYIWQRPKIVWLCYFKNLDIWWWMQCIKYTFEWSNFISNNISTQFQAKYYGCVCVTDMVTILVLCLFLLLAKGKPDRAHNDETNTTESDNWQQVWRSAWRSYTIYNLSLTSGCIIHSSVSRDATSTKPNRCQIWKHCTYTSV